MLQRTLAEAHLWARDLRAGTSLIDIARKTGRSEPNIRTRIPLAVLAPKAQAAIRDDIPMDWTVQARMFAIAGSRDGPNSR